MNTYFDTIPKTLVLFVFITKVTSFDAQELWRSEEIPVIIDGENLLNPWAGGLNFCQFSTIDLNLDEREDLFVFDRTGERITCYLNKATQPGEIYYDHEFSYTLDFPDSLRNWALLRDYNCDGKKDIFTNISSGFRLYENESTVGNVSFSLRSSLTQASYNFSGTAFNAPVYSIGVDLPGIVDYDNDGDIDIFSFTETSVTMYYYKNLAQEIGQCDSLAYVCGNRCYGMFSESPESFTLFKGEEAQCDFNVIDPRYDEDGQPMRHTGGTICNIDLDQNGIKDLIIGDVTEPNLASLEMTNSADDLDSAIVCHLDFPATFSGTIPVDMQLFPGAFYEDVDNDGVNDLLVSSNSFANADDTLSVWFYKNEGQNDLPQFEFQQKNFLQNTMIDLGLGALPVLEDLSGDGLLDLLVANHKYFSAELEFTSKLWYFRNTGTTDNPEFTLVDDNYLDIPQQQKEAVYPSFADLDNDGDHDLVLGDQAGILQFYRNSSGVGLEASFVLEQSPMTDSNDEEIDIGQFATPQLIDVTDDGIIDLIVGEKNGNINLFENTGTLENWSFTLVEDTIGNVVASNYLGINGYSVPHFIRNENNILELLIGTETGVVNHYNNIEGNFLADFNLVTEEYENIKEGERSAVFAGDMNADGKRDLFYGNYSGGLAFYSGDTVVGNIDETQNITNLQLYPNPAGSEINLDLHSVTSHIDRVELYDITGRLLILKQCEKMTSEIVLSISSLPMGIYIVKVTDNTGHVYVRKFEKG